jgi:hypothetical protein
MRFSDVVQSWHDFYVTAGAAAATLVGLLFVGLSLHIRVVVSHQDVRSLARVTLTDFVAVLLIALLLLAPAGAIGSATTVGMWLILIALVSFALTVRSAVDGFRTRRSTAIRLRVLLARFGMSWAGYAGVGFVGVLLAVQDASNGLSVLFGVVVILLVVAVRNTWDLLVTVADHSERRETGAR